MRKDGVSKKEVARNFKLSPSRIYLIERRDAADRSMCERRGKSREEIRAVADLDRMWPVNDLVDAIGLIVVTRKRLLDHFAEVGKQQITLREFMDRCLDAPVEGLDLMMSPLLRVRGVGKIGFWSVVNGLTGMDLGDRCNEEWRKILVKVKQESEIKPPTS
jgi:hypothetical protein